MIISAYKGTEATNALKIAIESLEKLKTEILVLEQKADEVTGKIMSVKDVSNTFGKWYSNIGSHFKKSNIYSDNSPKAIAKRAQLYLKSLYIPAVKIHKENIPAIENNKALETKIRLTMLNIGIATKYVTYEHKTTRSTKKTKYTHNAGFIDDIQRLVKTNDGFKDIKTGFVKRWNDINTYLKQEQAKEKEIEIEKERKLATENAEKQRAALTIKYNLPYESYWPKILEIILAKDKYLALAHALMMNRIDWNDGCWYAENGLSKFKTETNEDRKIYKNIRNCIDNWDGDGRVFRDTKYNYDVIFGMADQALIADYNLAYDHI